MPHPVFAANNTALITGGASGIGLAVAQLCLKHGMRVAIADRNPDNLARASSLLAAGDRVATYETDVSQPSAWDTLKAGVLERFQRVDFLMLNAGIGLKGTWGIGTKPIIADAHYRLQTLSTNLFGVIHGLNAFVPHIQPSPTPSAIVITGSKQGITNPPGNAAYNASKSAVNTLAEHLSYDLRATPQHSVHLLVPGWTFTGMTGGGTVKEKPAGAWAPEQVAAYLEEKMGEGKFYVICPDNDVSEEMDRKRVLWAAGDLAEGRPPLSRWREEWKGEVEKFMSGDAGPK
ncbi:short chain dehydrogenase/reductase [Macrophomina phaseolina]|uniref:Short chain dehydrogenase/reductase n=1 Tax=Macrophomina phaseolina TaxID=35725 RepID=A0ABQ8FXD6_9PEZI|nr:short chain dehydrogenase/reductase [Macrophomina phaseolina]